jgi:hypothetical protein
MAASCLALLLAAGCASTQVSDREVVATGKLPRPGHILVYDFGASPADVPPGSALAGGYEPGPPPTAAELAVGRELGAEIARALVEEIQQMGLPAERAAPGRAPQLDDLVLRGTFVSIEQGSAAERMVIGFGAGASQLRTFVEGFQMTPEGLRKLGSGTVAAGGPKGPGAALPAAVAIATANPIGLVVTGAVKAGGELSGRSTIEGRARQTAQEIAEQIEPRFQEQGWIP